MNKRMLGTALVVGGLLGCTTILGIGDLPARSETPAEAGIGDAVNSDVVDNDGAGAPDTALADAGQTEDADCGAGLDRDPLNCGYCGHTCRGTACSAGRCAVVTISSTENTPVFVRADDTAAYWASGNSIRRSILDGAGTSTIVTAPNCGIQGLDLTAARAYWSCTGNGNVQSAPLPNGGPIVTLATTPTGNACQVGVGASSIFWNACAYGGPLLMAPLTGAGDAGSQFATDPSNFVVGKMHVDATDLYWVSEASSANEAGLSAINHVSRAGIATAEAPTLLKSDNGIPGSAGLVGDATRLFWGNGAGEIWTAAKPNGSNPTVIASAPDPVKGIATDGMHLYWIGGVKLYRANMDGSAAGLVASSDPTDAGVAHITGMAVSAGWVVWSREDGTVAKVAK